MYYDLSGNIFSFWNRFQQESVLVHNTIILVTLFCNLKILQL